MRRMHWLALLALSSAHAASPDMVIYSGVPCGIAASMTAALDSPQLNRLK
jgi:hypothetical protein